MGCACLDVRIWWAVARMALCPYISVRGMHFVNFLLSMCIDEIEHPAFCLHLLDVSLFAMSNLMLAVLPRFSIGSASKRRMLLGRSLAGCIFLCVQFPMCMISEAC